MGRDTREALETRVVLSAYLFDAEQSERVMDWRSAFEGLGSGQLLWLALRDPSEDEEDALVDALGLGHDLARRLRDSPERASVADDGERLYVTLVAVAGDEDAPAFVPIDCLLGPNWVVTAHREEVEVLEEFLERVEGGGQVVDSTLPRSLQQFASGSSPATSAPSRRSRVSWRSLTRRSCRKPRAEMFPTS